MLSSLNSNNTFKISFLIAVFHFLHIDDDDNKRRRFCVICRVCKPRSSHHCGRFPLALESGKSDGDGINWKTVPINEEQVDDFQQD